MTTVIACLDDLLAKVQSIAVLRNTSQQVFSPEDLVKVIKGVSVPACGVVYEGLRAIAEDGKTSRGIGSNATFGLYLAVDASQVSMTVNQAPTAIALLSELRDTLHDKKAPPGHFWQFLSESYADSFPGRTLWVQKWSTKLMGVY